VTNIVTTDPTVITNTNNVAIFSTNVFFTNTTTAIPDSRVSSTVPTGTTNTFDPLPLINRGLSGGFQAQLQNKGAYMSFAGNGQLSTPSQAQSVTVSSNADGSQRVGGIITETVPFFVNGLRTSFSTSLSVSTTGQ
jgi:hypothetical protein